MSRQAMNYLLGELEQMGYLVRRRDPLDLRSRRIELTGRGRDARQTMRATVSNIEDELGRDLGPARLVLLKELLVELNRSEFVRRFRTTTGQAIVIPETTPATKSVRHINGPSPNSG
jgi:DNA-binding MarR family transcriptional regulator